MLKLAGAHERGRDDVVDELIARSNRLGADPRNTNYAGGNTSAKAEEIDPVTARPVELLWVKGSGGDLGTLTRPGLAVLRLDRLRALVDAYPGVEREDEMVAAFDYCAHGKGGAAPSIDTAMHGLVDAPHVDHLHPDAGIALATAVDGERLTKECFGDRVVWVPWRRPGFQLGLDIAEVARTHPKAIGVILAGHGITAWGRTSDECEANSVAIIQTAQAFLDARGEEDPFGAVVPGFDALAPADRRRRAAALMPVIRGLVSTDHPQVGHFTDSDVVLDFCRREELTRLAALGTSCPDHFLRTKVRPLVLDVPPTAPLDEAITRLGELHAAYRDDYRAYYERHAEPQSPPMRGADPAIVLVPGVGMFSFGANKQTAPRRRRVLRQRDQRDARRRVGVDLCPDPRVGEVPHRVLVARGGQAQTAPSTAAARHACRLRDGRRVRHRTRHRPPARRRGRLRRRCRRGRARPLAWSPPSSARPTSRCRWKSTSPMPPQVAAAFAEAVLAFGGVDLVVNNAGLSISKPLLETTESDWDRQHDVMAKGSFLVAREAARVMIDQAMGGDIVYVCSKNALVAGPDNLAYGAAKADQAHQVRLLAAELGAHGIRVNGVNPDAVVRGSGIFANGWGAQRAAVYGVPEDELGTFYAQRTLAQAGGAARARRRRRVRPHWW